jgi:hypothetical protein
VERILLGDGTVCDVEMEDGHRIECNCVISSASMASIGSTFERLLSPDAVSNAGYDRLMVA